MLTNKHTLEHLYTFKNFPVFIGCTDQPKSKDLRADMTFDICTLTGMIQLRDLLPLNLIYSGYHSEAIGKVWQNHHRRLARFISQYKPRHILEIGGSNGALAEIYLASNKINSWTIVEPNPAISSHGKVKVINDFFDDKFKLNHSVDIVVHSHVLEHLYSPRNALDHINQFLLPGKLHIFSVPQLHWWLKNFYPNTLNFEHTYFLTEYFATQLLSAHGFKLLKKSNYMHHSTFYASKKLKNKPPLRLSNHYRQYRRIYLKFINHHHHQVKLLNNKISTFSGPIYLFGAHIFSQFLIEMGLDTQKITGILDDSTIKQGQRLYGSRLHVYDPQSIATSKNVMVIVKAGSYTSDIKTRLMKMNKSLAIV